MRKRLTLSFHEENAEHMQAYQRLMEIKSGARSDYVAMMISRFDTIEECVYEAVKRALDECPEQLNLSKEREVPQEMLDFAFSL